MGPKLKLHVGQQQVMTPQLLQSIRLLQLSSLELEQEVRQALESNVMLEETDEEQPLEAELPAPVLEDEAKATDSTEAAVTGCDTAASDKVEADFDWSSSESWSGGEPVDEDGESFESRTPARRGEDLRMEALAQLRMMVNDERQALLVSALIEQIDDNGYLELPLEQVLARLPEQWQVRLAELEAALRLVQSVEPTGFGARDLRECLLLQLDELRGDTGGLELARRLVAECLERIGGDPAALAREIACGMDEFGQAMRLIRSLDPKPGSSAREPAQCVVPDVMVSGEGQSWKVELNPATLPRVRVNTLYEKLLAGKSHRGMREQLQEARWLVNGLEMRHQTLLKTARAVFARQCEFLRRGEEGMAPLTLREVAAQIGMHESTVCRVVNSKFVQTPWGVYPMKAFFPSQIAHAQGETSGTAVKAMIRRIVDGENRAAPLCDGAIAALLARSGVRVARRTVAKYREAMKIAPAVERRRPAQGAMALAG
ncbi:MAG: RNA polymerase factor sigma-54 [Nevskia sp.]|nr:RNA polymerase factor sigma-54 [Nevskia sp.]